MKLLQRVYAMLAFCSILTFPSFTNAQAVQVCDMDAYTLYKETRILLFLASQKYVCQDLKYIGKMSPESPYDLYTFVVKPTERFSTDSAVVSFFCNGAGYISKITVMTDDTKQNSSKDMEQVTISMLVLMGVSQSEFYTLFSEKNKHFSNGTTYRDIWVTKLNRRIIMEFRIDTTENGARTAVTRLTATDI